MDKDRRNEVDLQALPAAWNYTWWNSWFSSIVCLKNPESVRTPWNEGWLTLLSLTLLGAVSTAQKSLSLPECGVDRPWQQEPSVDWQQKKFFKNFYSCI